MLQTYEAELQPNGMLRFAPPSSPRYNDIQKVLVTVLAREQVEPAPSRPAQPHATNGWGHLLGALKDSPNFRDDPVLIQQRLRSEWD